MTTTATNTTSPSVSPINPVAGSKLGLHVFYAVVIVGLLLGFRAWLFEHDQRLTNEKAAAVSQQEVKTLQAQVDQLRTQTASQIAVVKKESAAIKTTAQAIPVINSFDGRLAARVSPTLPDAVEVPSVPLAQDLEQCRVDRVNLGADQVQIGLQQQQITDQQTEIKALKQKPSFWKRVKHDALSIGIGVALGETARLALAGKL